MDGESDAAAVSVALTVREAVRRQRRQASRGQSQDPVVQPGTGRPHRGLRPQAAQHQLSGAVQPALQCEQGSSSCRARVGGRLEHYVYRNSPPGWCCQALPHQPRPPPGRPFRSRAPRHDAEPALQGHGPTHGVVTTRFVHRGVPWDDDRQTGDDQRVSTMICRAGATTMGKRCPPARPWTTSRTGSDQEVSLSRAPPHSDNPGQPKRVGHRYSMGKNACSSRSWSADVLDQRKPPCCYQAGAAHPVIRSCRSRSARAV
jgi:hypothetical protein